MRVYAVVEGKTEAELYAAWLNYAYPGIRRVERIEDMEDNSYFLQSNMGFPCILQSIEDAVSDISNNAGMFQLLLMALDADEGTVEARRNELAQALSACPIPTVMAIQDCCIETWLLGNRKFVPSHDGGGYQRLAECRAHYDVRALDPEFMPPPMDYELSVMAYHLRYLKAVFASRRESYRKSRPGVATEEHFLIELVRRHADTGHLASFGVFLHELRAAGATGPFAIPG